MISMMWYQLKEKSHLLSGLFQKMTMSVKKTLISFDMHITYRLSKYL